MGKQDRRDKASKAAKAQAAAIVDKAVAEAVQAAQASEVVMGSQPATHAHQRPEGLDDKTWYEALAVRALRDEGTPWWRIAWLLALPGAGETVATGKRGAGYARKVYAKAFGAHPRSQRVRGSVKKRESNADRAALKAVKKADRVAQVRAGKPVLREDMTNEEVVAAVRGRTIGWTSRIAVGEGEPILLEQEADVHGNRVGVKEYPRSGRCVVFFEVDRRAPVEWREVANGVKHVPLNQIHTIR